MPEYVYSRECGYSWENGKIIFKITCLIMLKKSLKDLCILLLFQVMVVPRTGHAEDHKLQRRWEVFQPQDQSPVLPQREWLGLLQLHVLECKYRNGFILIARYVFQRGQRTTKEILSVFDEEVDEVDTHRRQKHDIHLFVGWVDRRGRAGGVV